MYTVIEKIRDGQRISKIKSYDEAKKQAQAIKEKTGNDCNVLTDGIAVWTTETNSNTDAIFFI